MHHIVPTNPNAEPTRLAANLPVRSALRLNDVLDLLPVSKSTLYDRIAKGSFPPPFKNGKISLWRSEDVAQWFADPTNLLDYVEYRRSRSRARGQSLVFRGNAVAWVEQVECLAEALILTALVLQYRQLEAEGRVSRFDREAAAALEIRLQELRAGADSRIDALAWWAPPRRVAASSSGSTVRLNAASRAALQHSVDGVSK